MSIFYDDNHYTMGKKGICKKNSFTNTENDDESGVKYLTDIVQLGFDPSLKHQATMKSCDTTKLCL